MPEPSATELAKEAEQEAAVFAQAMNVEKLLNMLKALDPAKDNLADNEEIQVGDHLIFSVLSFYVYQCLIFF
jgi:signal transducing adaptor molecule